MAKTAGALVAMVMLMGVGATRAAEAADSRVRTDSPLLARLIDEASARSATFRTLVDTINATDGIVYLQTGRCPGRVQACLSHSVTRSGPNRVLRIVVNVDRAENEVMASMGHELRHALEVLEDVTVDSNAAIYFFYRRFGSGSADRFETDAAIRAENQVRKEVR